MARQRRPQLRHAWTIDILNAEQHIARAQGALVRRSGGHALHANERNQPQQPTIDLCAIDFTCGSDHHLQFRNGLQGARYFRAGSGGPLGIKECTSGAIGGLTQQHGDGRRIGSAFTHWNGDVLLSDAVRLCGAGAGRWFDDLGQLAEWICFRSSHHWPKTSGCHG